jgi:hypothetical protein
MEEKIICSVNSAGMCGVISICIFVAFFTGMLLWAFAKKKNYLDKMSSLPLDGGETNSTDKIQS